jgi:glycosyltransferase involved in cell wall biosynthesis
MSTSIIITARDEDPGMLKATLDGLRATTRGLPIEVIVVDDGSTSPIDSRAIGDARLLRHPTSRGVCESRRIAAQLAAGEVLIWLDAHMSFGKNWLPQLLVQAHTDRLVSSPFWSYDLKDCLCWGADFTWNAERNLASGRSPGFGVHHRVDPPHAAAVEVPMVIGACYAMHREAYSKLGGFCPHFKVWGIDEQDMSARAWMAGLTVVCATHAQVGHFSRKAFPYPVNFEHLEFNQLVMIRSLFDSHTAKQLEEPFQPMLPAVNTWLADLDLIPWRKSVQRRRKLSDREFFDRFVPSLQKAVPVKSRAGKARSAKDSQHRGDLHRDPARLP